MAPETGTYAQTPDGWEPEGGMAWDEFEWRKVPPHPLRTHGQVNPPDDSRLSL
jgi:hypothetical protein